jgi:hypothetical protein
MGEKFNISSPQKVACYRMQLHNVDPLHSLPGMQMIKLRAMRWARLVSRIEKIGNEYRSLVRIFERDCMEELIVNRKVILKWILRE